MLPLFRCIDGYSRRIMWLQCGSSNHLSSVVAGYYWECVLNIGGYPSKVRTDCGTENVTVAAIQSLCHGSTGAHIYGTSPGNQRIEAWWSFLRRNRSQWWIELFETLSQSGSFHMGHGKETDCLRFCFMDLLQLDLDDVRKQWNIHRIRPSVGSRCPAGIPDELFYLPDPPAVDCLVRTPMTLPPEVVRMLEAKSTCQDEQFGNYLLYLCAFHHWTVPATVDEALKLYFKLLPLI
jgi:hypothetical protein